MVDDEIDEHTYAALLRAVGEFDKIADRAVARIDAVVIGHVVTMVAIGRDLERHQPDGRDSEAVQIIQTTHQTLEVADPVAVGVHVSSHRQTIDHRVLVPKVTDHRAARDRIEATNKPERIWGSFRSLALGSADKTEPA
jgi:hypothetical protein